MGESYSEDSKCPSVNAFKDTTFTPELAEMILKVYPSGVLLLDPGKTAIYNSVDDLYPHLGLQTNSILELIDIRESRVNGDKVFYSFKQLYNGVPILGGGMTVGTYGLSTDGGNPCDLFHGFLLSPSIYTDLTVNTTPTIIRDSLPRILGTQNINDQRLVITNNIDGNCDYHLTYEVKFRDSIPEIAWIDAHTGQILKKEKNIRGLTAVTEIYNDPVTGNVNLNDRLDDDGITTFLETPGQDIRAYDFGLSNISCFNVKKPDWTDNLIPQTTSTTSWPSTSGSAALYQSFFVANRLKPIFSDIEINFESISIGARCSGVESWSYINYSNIENAYISVGAFTDPSTNTSYSMSTYDIIGHELGHSYLETYITGNVISTNSIHEAIADIIGAFVESKAQGDIDWLLGDDIFYDLRDAQNPLFTCFSQVENELNIYQRAAPLTYWFYLITEGDNTIGLPALGIDRAMEILLGGVELLNGGGADYGNIKDVVDAYVLDEYGDCGDELLAIRMAWDQICIDAQIPTCTFEITGPPLVCEENMPFTKFSTEPFEPINTYRWYYPLEWTIDGTGPNGEFYGPTLKVIDFPNYVSYPQYFTLKVVKINAGESRTYDVKLNDCNGDTPPCPYALIQNTSEIDVERNIIQQSPETTKPSTLVVYDTMGRILYYGPTDDFQMNLIQSHGILILSYLDDKGKVINVSKTFKNR